MKQPVQIRLTKLVAGICLVFFTLPGNVLANSASMYLAAGSDANRQQLRRVDLQRGYDEYTKVCERWLDQYRAENLAWAPRYRDAKDETVRELARSILSGSNLADTINELKESAKDDEWNSDWTIDKAETELLNYVAGMKSVEESGGFSEEAKAKYFHCHLAGRVKKEKELTQWMAQAANAEANSKKTNSSTGQTKSSSTSSQNRKPQTVSAGPISVTLIPTNSTLTKCYDIQYENRGDKNVDIFIKLTLTNNKTGEKGTSIWLGENTQFDGLFGSANINKMGPKTHASTTKTTMYGAWLMGQNFIFTNQPSNMYGFNNTVESCGDITAEIPAGGVKWNENAYQRHYDACSSPIKRNRPVGC